jgi:RimJ/RimL family protein N-acetyltransferase
MIILEKFLKKDVGLILKWFENPNNRFFQNTKSINQEKAEELIQSDDNKKVFLIKLNKEPIGYCMLKDILSSAKVGIAIDEPFWGKGYGKEAMKLLEKEAIDLGVTNLGLMVRIQNTRAVRLYEGLGYEKTNFIMEKSLIS